MFSNALSTFSKKDNDLKPGHYHCLISIQLRLFATSRKYCAKSKIFNTLITLSQLTLGIHILNAMGQESLSQWEMVARVNVTDI